MAAINGVHLNLISTAGRPSFVIEMPTLYFGLPILRYNNETYSYEKAQEIAAKAVNKAERMTWTSWAEGNVNKVSLTKIYLDVLQGEMSPFAGTVSKEPGYGIIIPSKDITDAQYPGFLGLGCL